MIRTSEPNLSWHQVISPLPRPRIKHNQWTTSKPQVGGTPSRIMTTTTMITGTGTDMDTDTDTTTTTSTTTTIAGADVQVMVSICGSALAHHCGVVPGGDLATSRTVAGGGGHVMVSVHHLGGHPGTARVGGPPVCTRGVAIAVGPHGMSHPPSLCNSHLLCLQHRPPQPNQV